MYMHMVSMCVNMVHMSLIVQGHMYINACVFVNIRVCMCSVHGACGVMYGGALCAVGRTEEAFESLPSLGWRRDWREGFGTRGEGCGACFCRTPEG